jgi:hypothetical protein
MKSRISPKRDAALAGAALILFAAYQQNHKHDDDTLPEPSASEIHDVIDQPPTRSKD